MCQSEVFGTRGNSSEKRHRTQVSLPARQRIMRVFSAPNHPDDPRDIRQSAPAVNRRTCRSPQATASSTLSGSPVTCSPRRFDLWAIKQAPKEPSRTDYPHFPERIIGPGPHLGRLLIDSTKRRSLASTGDVRVIFRGANTQIATTNAKQGPK
jgi:hypothetical protein